MFGDKGLWPSRSSDYLDAEESKPLSVPDSINAAQVGDAYPIPELEFASVLPDKFVLPRVDALGETESRGSVRIQNLLDDRWILVNRSPTQTWPLVLEFLSSNQVALEEQSANAGFIETDWLKDNSGEISDIEKYRFIFKAGVQAETTEVLIKQFQRGALDEAATTDWKKSTSEDREENMANSLAQFLASSPDSASHSLLAQGLSTANKASIEYDEQGAPYISLQLPYHRGWASLGLALNKSSFTVSDLNRDQGLYYANFEPGKVKKKKRSWIRRIFSRGPDKAKEIGGEYRITITETDFPDVLRIAIEPGGEGSLANNEQAFLLNRILPQLT